MKNRTLRKYLLTGLGVWLPIIVTFLIVRFIVDLLDQTISLFPESYQPKHLFGFNLPGLGVILSLCILFLTGLIATNFFGQRLMIWSETILDKIPLVRSIYNASKQVFQALFASKSQSFRKVLLVEYPRKGLWTIGFQTGMMDKASKISIEEIDMVTIFIPTTPNPTSGFLVVVPKSDVKELDMSIDEALKFIISLGMVEPNEPTPHQIK